MPGDDLVLDLDQGERRRIPEEVVDQTGHHRPVIAEGGEVHTAYRGMTCRRTVHGRGP